MKKNTSFRVIRIVSILLLIAAVALAMVLLGKKDKNSITIGTGGTKGMYYKYTQVLANIEKGNLNIRIKETEGSQANLRLIRQKYLDVAIVQNDTLYDAANGFDEYIDNSLGDKRSFSAVCTLYTESVNVIVRKDSGIKSISDLKGKTVSVGKEESGVKHNAKEVLSVYGMTLEDIKPEYLSYEESSDALVAGSIDAFFCNCGNPAEVLTDLANKADVEFLSISDEDVKRLKTINPAYVNVTIPAGTYKGQDSDVKTVGIYAVLVAQNDLDEDTVYELTKDIYEKSDEINQALGTAGELKPSEQPDRMVIPFHKGAARYYRELNVSVDEDKAD